MKLQSLIFRNSLFILTLILALPVFRAAAQSKPDSVSAAQAAAVPARITQAIDEAQVVRLSGNVHPLARPEFDQGIVSDATPMNRMLLILQRSPEQQTALSKFMDEQISKDSPNFHKWLTPQEFGKLYGPADADIQAVTDWLTRQGFQGIKVGAGRTAIEFSGSVAQVRNGFHTEIHSLTVNGEAHMANMSDPQIPAALAPVVRGVVSLHNFRHQPQARFLGSFQRTKATGEVKPLFTYTDSNGQFFGLGPADFAKIYNIPPTATGAGVTIAIVGRTNLNVQDVRAFRAMFGLPANDPIVVLNGPDPGIVSKSEETEADLDVEWSGAVAPGATIKLVVTETPSSNASDGIDLSALYIVDNNLAAVMSESFGSCEAGMTAAGNQFQNNVWEQAAAQGITVTVSSGDNGSAGCDPAAPPATQNAATLGLAVNGIASTPFNIAVGGTDFDNSLTGYPSPYWSTTNTATTPPASSAQSYIPEVPWNDSCAAGGSLTGCATVNTTGRDLIAGSGGPSNCSTQNSSGACTAGYPKPSWQTGPGVPADGVRDIPDVSLFASDGHHASFYIFCQSDEDPIGGSGCDLATSLTSPNHNFQAVGGTSASAPSFAAIMALVNQQTGQRQGIANPVLYALAATSGNSCTSNAAAVSNTNCVFYDVAKSNNSVACQGGSPNCSNTSTAAGAFGIMATAKGGTTPAFNAGGGYDLATGLGSVNVANLLLKWSTALFTATTTTLQSITPTTITHGQSVNVSVQVTSAVGTPAGDVSLIAAATPAHGIGPFTLASGTAAFSTNLLPGGTYNITAHYAGDGTHAASDSAPPGIQVTVAKENSQTVLRFVTFAANGLPIFNAGAMTVAYGSPYIVRVDVRNGAGVQCSPDLAAPTTPPTAPCPTGTVNLTDNGSPLKDFIGASGSTGTTTLNSQGYLEDQPIQLPASTTPHSLAAAYLGDNSYNASNSTALAITINQAATTTAVQASPASIVSGGSVTLTALVSTTSNGDAPCDGTANTGTVQFSNGSTPLSGTVSYTATSGAASSTGAASCVATLTTTLAMFPPLNMPRTPSVPRVPLFLLATILALLVLLLRWTPRTKRRYAYAGLAALALLALGFAGCSNSGGGGSHTANITAKYSGDTNYTGSTSAATPVTIR